MKNLIILTIAIFFCSSTINAQKKQSISVLYVGFNPEMEMPKKDNTTWTSQERFAQEYKTRMPAFISYLEQYFDKVGSVDAREYTSNMSNNYDVTVFDETPKVISEMVYERDPKTGKTLKYVPATYIEEGYNRPSVFIGHPADKVGRNLGSKLDWYCLCLDKYAHHIKTEHEIFKGPFSVDLSIESKPTPKPIFKYPNGFNMPKEIPMWKVNTEGYHDEKGYRIGLVSRGWGFEDSPDAEVISSGVCDKDKSAVALGRHGNFFLWGFAGSPDYMTEEAKKVFANAIVYTHKNKEEKIITKKGNDRIATKLYVDELLHYTTKRAFESSAASLREFVKNSLEQQKKAKTKKANGEKLNQMEEMMLNYKPQPELTREQFLQKNIGRNSFSKITGIDTLKVRAYLKENLPYFYSEPSGFYDLKLDEDCKELGIANTDINLLETAIKLFDKDQAKAKRILWRYTLESFETKKEWKKWYKKYQHNFFFTQAGGYVWMINDPDANPNVKPRDDKDINF